MPFAENRGQLPLKFVISSNEETFSKRITPVPCSKLLVSPSSTAVDRIALYMMPLQLIVLPRFVFLFQSRQVGRLVVILYAAAIQFTWLNFATHAQYWVPYQFFPLGG